MKNSLVKKGAAVLAILALFAGVACQEEDDNSDEQALLLLAGTAASDICTFPTYSWSGTYQLTSPLTVNSGECLKVDAGTTVYGSAGSYIMIKPGAKIYAVGTDSNPVVFTSSNAAGSRAPGNWGGIVIVGNARIDSTAAQAVEGLTSGTVNFPGAAYGSRDDTESSGSLVYARIEYAGYTVTEGNELNGLTLYAVGSGTAINNVQVNAGSDDGIEIFGGAVNLTNIVLTGISDDSLDLDTGWHGTVSNLVAMQYASSYISPLADRLFEHDGWHADETLATADQDYGASDGTVKNFTIIGTSGAGDAITARHGFIGKYENGLVIDAGSEDLECSDGATTGSKATFTNIMIAGTTGGTSYLTSPSSSKFANGTYTGIVSGTATYTAYNGSTLAFPNQVTSGEITYGADTSFLGSSWTNYAHN